MTTVRIYTRPPIPGRTKTRLARVVGDEAAAALHRAFLEDTIAHAAALPGARVVLDATEVDATLASLGEHHGLPLVVQRSGDLGARMAASIADALLQDACVLVLGSDAPTLGTPLLREAERTLGHADVVLSPTEDGGYALLGSRRPLVLADVRWSTEHARADTERALETAGLAWARLSASSDVDDAAGLERLLRTLERAPDDAPVTARCLHALGLLRL